MISFLTSQLFFYYLYVWYYFSLSFLSLRSGLLQSFSQSHTLFFFFHPVQSFPYSIFVPYFPFFLSCSFFPFSFPVSLTKLSNPSPNHMFPIISLPSLSILQSIYIPQFLSFLFCSLFAFFSNFFFSPKHSSPSPNHVSYYTSSIKIISLFHLYSLFSLFFLFSFLPSFPIPSITHSSPSPNQVSYYSSSITIISLFHLYFPFSLLSFPSSLFCLLLQSLQPHIPVRLLTMFPIIPLSSPPLLYAVRFRYFFLRVHIFFPLFSSSTPNSLQANFPNLPDPVTHT